MEVSMKISDVQLSILHTELDETVIPTQGAVGKLPELVLVSVSTHEGIDGHYVSYLIPAKADEHARQRQHRIDHDGCSFPEAALIGFSNQIIHRIRDLSYIRQPAMHNAG